MQRLVAHYIAQGTRVCARIRPLRPKQPAQSLDHETGRGREEGEEDAKPTKRGSTTYTHDYACYA
eukprot:3608624-Pyramimonas_sp.AAC.1